MLNPYLSEPERQFFVDYDFDDYSDPIVRSLHDWEQAGKNWNNIVRKMFYTTKMLDRFMEGEVQLGKAIDRYADNFTAAATLIAEDSPFEDRAVDVLDQLMRGEDMKRRRALYSFYDQSHLPKPSDSFFRDIALAYGDPHGEMLPDISERILQSPEAAKMVFMSNLDRQSDHILDRNRRMLWDQQQAEKRSRPRKIGSKAFGRYQNKDQ